MGITRKVVIGTLIVGAGALALSRNKKAVGKIRENVSKATKKVLHNGLVKKGRRLFVSRAAVNRKAASERRAKISNGAQLTHPKPAL